MIDWNVMVSMKAQQDLMQELRCPGVVGVSLETMRSFSPFIDHPRSCEDRLATECIAGGLECRGADGQHVTGEAVERRERLRQGEQIRSHQGRLCSSLEPTRPPAVMDFVAGSRIRSNENFAALASNGVPSWSFTSSRSVKVRQSVLADGPCG